MRTPQAGDEDDVWGGRNPTFRHPDQKIWMDRMGARGYTAPRFPREYGGAGLSSADATVLQEELVRAGCRMALKSFGLWMLAPVLLEYGSEAQKREHLPKIIRGEIRWCQGYSEPAAGSDLASLATKAILDGARGEYVVNGQKIWTSHADKADWMFFLGRTDPASQRQQGITFFLVDMKTPGISVKPIRLISGASPFCETFFDDVRVPAANVVGEVGAGWTIAKALLGHERTLISSLRDAASAQEEPLETQARRAGALGDAALRDRITQANMDFLCNRLTVRRVADTVAAGRAPGPEASALKLYGTELNKRRRELRVQIAGFQGIGWEGPGYAADELGYTRDWLRSRANSIEGGTTEVQLNIIAKRVLGLPDGESK